VRLASVQTLGRLADPQAASPLMTAMSDADESVRHAATEAVESLNFLEAG
jgi:HEAT repeat protein